MHFACIAPRCRHCRKFERPEEQELKMYGCMSGKGRVMERGHVPAGFMSHTLFRFSFLDLSYFFPFSFFVIFCDIGQLSSECSRYALMH